MVITAFGTLWEKKEDKFFGHNKSESWKSAIFTVKIKKNYQSRTLPGYLIWGRVFDRAGKGFGFQGDIFTPAQYSIWPLVFQ